MAGQQSPWQAKVLRGCKAAGLVFSLVWYALDTVDLGILLTLLGCETSSILQYADESFMFRPIKIWQTDSL